MAPARAGRPTAYGQELVLCAVRGLGLGAGEVLAGQPLRVPDLHGGMPGDADVMTTWVRTRFTTL